MATRKWERAITPIALVEIVAALALLRYLPRDAWLAWSALSTLVVALAALVSYRITSDGNDRPD